MKIIKLDNTESSENHWIPHEHDENHENHRIQS